MQLDLSLTLPPWAPVALLAVLLLLLAIVLVQIATSKHWRGGAPASFTREV